jgi:putative ABC transport system permease protein
VPGALAPRPSGDQVAIGPELAERLRVRLGERIRIGNGDFKIIGFIAESRTASGRASRSAPPLSWTAPASPPPASFQPGSLYTSAYRLQLPAGADVAARSKALATQYKDAGFQVQDRSNGAPGTRRFIERLGQFLTLVGLAALIVAGIGVGNGVGSYLDGKRGTIATLKLLGAQPHHLPSYLPRSAVALRRDPRRPSSGARSLDRYFRRRKRAPVPPRLAPTAAAAGQRRYGLLIAFTFAILPLARAAPSRASPVPRQPGAAGRALRCPAPPPARRPDRRARHLHRARAAVRRQLHRRGARLVLCHLPRRAHPLVASKLPRPRNPVFRIALTNLHRPAPKPAASWSRSASA